LKVYQLIPTAFATHPVRYGRADVELVRRGRLALNGYYQFILDENDKYRKIAAAAGISIE
jgi:hypothetical protein